MRGGFKDIFEVLLLQSMTNIWRLLEFKMDKLLLQYKELPSCSNKYWLDYKKNLQPLYFSMFTFPTNTLSQDALHTPHKQQFMGHNE